MTTEQTEQKKLLQKAAKDAESGLLKATKETIASAYEKFETAKKALEDFENSIIPAEQVIAQMEYNKAKEAYDLALKAMNEKKTALSLFTGKTENSKAPRMTYENVQLIRKDISEKMKHKDIQEKWGISATAINYYTNYLQHKLRRGDPEYTPLVNSYYPLGAPYAEDGVKEDDSRYTAKKYTLADLNKEYLDTALLKDRPDNWLELLARKYAMTVEKMRSLVNQPK